MSLSVKVDEEVIFHFRSRRRRFFLVFPSLYSIHGLSLSSHICSLNFTSYLHNYTKEKHRHHRKLSNRKTFKSTQEFLAQYQVTRLLITSAVASPSWQFSDSHTKKKKFKYICIYIFSRNFKNTMHCLNKRSKIK